MAVLDWECLFFIPSLWSLFGPGLSTFYFNLWDASVFKRLSKTTTIISGLLILVFIQIVVTWLGLFFPFVPFVPFVN